MFSFFCLFFSFRRVPLLLVFCVLRFSHSKNSKKKSKIKKKRNDSRVTFIDFGNAETVAPSSLRRLPAELAATPPQAHTAKLAFVKEPPTASGKDDEEAYDDDLGADAADLVASALGGGAPLEALVVSRAATAGSGQQGKALSLIILDDGKDKKVDSSVNAELLRSGLLRLDKPRLLSSSSSSRSRGGGGGSSAAPAHISAAISALEAAQDEAKKSRSGIWEYGDCGGDSDDDGFAGQRRGGGGGGAWGGRGGSRR